MITAQTTLPYPELITHPLFLPPGSSIYSVWMLLDGTPTTAPRAWWHAEGTYRLPDPSSLLDFWGDVMDSCGNIYVLGLGGGPNQFGAAHRDWIPVDPLVFAPHRYVRFVASEWPDTSAAGVIVQARIGRL